MTMGTVTEGLDQLLYAVAVVIRIFAPCFGKWAPLALTDVCTSMLCPRTRVDLGGSDI
jgi:hypothetical protein